MTDTDESLIAVEVLSRHTTHDKALFAAVLAYLAHNDMLGAVCAAYTLGGRARAMDVVLEVLPPELYAGMVARMTEHF